MKLTPVQRSLCARAAVLFFLGLLTGLWVAVVLTHGKAGGFEMAKREHEGLALAAHLNALLGCFWMIAVALTLEATRFQEKGKRALAWLVTIVNYANWLVTVLGSIFDVRGLTFGEAHADGSGAGSNNAIAAVLLALVVLPSFVAGGLWAWGLLGSPPPDAKPGA